ncbi:MAG: AraC family transcriptional regulator [Oscillospiraceae bacterium]|nr:AraC family transcriptional regulator [Oscillospiraceae bacterium]
MEWIGRLNQAVSYIEDQLSGTIDYEQLGRIACCSSYHFQRMFGYIAGISLSEYIRRRRMSLAAVDLLSGTKVIDVALKYGYSSPTAFNRAFQSVHELTPSQVRTENAVIKSYPPLTFKLTIKGATEMNYRIEKKEAFRIVGVSCSMDRDVEKNFQQVPKLWQQAAVSGLLMKLPLMMDSKVKGVLGVCACGSQEAQWKYYLSVASTQPAGEDMEEYIVPAATWAVFPAHTAGEARDKNIQGLCQRIITEWLPSSGYEYDNGPDIEVYLDNDPEDMHYEIWIPVVKKSDNA